MPRLLTCLSFKRKLVSNLSTKRISKIIDFGKSLYLLFHLWVVALAITLFVEQDKKIAKTHYFVWRRRRLVEQSGNPILVFFFIPIPNNTLNFRNQLFLVRHI